MIILGDETVRCLAPCLPGPALSVHQRALAAWRSLPQEVQLQWNALVWNVEPHRPPFDHSTRISGYNLFVSAYHGFATLGDEHVPVPTPFEKFPSFQVAAHGSSRQMDLIFLEMAVSFAPPVKSRRYHLLAKLQLTHPGKGCKPGMMRNVLADLPCSSSLVKLVFDPSIWGLNLEQYQVHARFILIDTVTGYRSQYLQKSFSLSISSQEE